MIRLLWWQDFIICNERRSLFKSYELLHDNHMAWCLISVLERFFLNTNTQRHCLQFDQILWEKNQDTHYCKTQWLSTHSGCQHTVAVNTQAVNTQAVNTQWLSTHSGCQHTGSVNTQWLSTHRLSTHSGCQHIGCQHTGCHHTVAVNTQTVNFSPTSMSKDLNSWLFA